MDHVKLLRNLPQLRFEHRIHEQILGAIYRAGGRVDRCGLYVVHSGYDHSPQGQAKKRERDLRLLELDLQDRPDHPFVLFNIGMTAYHMRDFDKAAPALERCLERAGPQESIVRKAYAMLAGCHLERGELPQAKALVEQGLALHPHDPELLFRAGIIYHTIGDLVAAERSYLTLTTAREVGHIDSLDTTMTTFKAHHNLALIYQEMGKLQDAEQQWRQAVAFAPESVPSWIGLAELYIRLRRFEDAREVSSTLAACAPDQAQQVRQRLP